jgi:F0F1-type ATP synthase assembly protein I
MAEQLERNPQDSKVSDSQPDPTTTQSPLRILASLVLGCVLGIPTGILLAYLAALPGYLGLFFCLLFGLLIGASMYRVGKPAAPVPVGMLVSVAAVVTLLTVFTSVYAEYCELYRSVDNKVRDSFFESFTAERRQELRTQTYHNVDEYLARNHSPGGFVGYLGWIITDGDLEVPRVFGESTVSFETPQRGFWWVLRVLLSIGLLGWTILSQFIGLRARESTQGSDGPEESSEESTTTTGS